MNSARNLEVFERDTTVRRVGSPVILIIQSGSACQINRQSINRSVIAQNKSAAQPSESRYSEKLDSEAGLLVLTRLKPQEENLLGYR